LSPSSAEHGPHLVAREDQGQTPGRPGANEAGELSDLAADDVAVEEQECGESLGLRRGADVFDRREVREEGVDLRLSHVGGMADAVEANETPDPEAVRLLGAPAVVAGAQGGAQLGFELGHGRVLRGWLQCGAARLKFNG
jgi:hypothetical protein